MATEHSATANIPTAVRSEDPEKLTTCLSADAVVDRPLSTTSTATHGQVSRLPSLFGHLQQFQLWLDRKIGIEVQGIDRIPEHQKQPPPLLNLFMIWGSFNVHVGSITLGILGPELGLSLHSTVAACMIGIVVGALGSAFTATLGPIVSLFHVAPLL